MVWTISFDSSVERDLKKLDKSVQKKIVSYLKTRVGAQSSPRQLGKPLKGKMAGVWRYRLGDYRILCRLLDEEMVVLVIIVAHRKTVYRE